MQVGEEEMAVASCGSRGWARWLTPCSGMGKSHWMKPLQVERIKGKQ
jgi:hypothetical protein